MTAIETKLAIDAAMRLDVQIGAHATDAGRQLGDALRPWLREGEILPDFTLALELPARMVRHAGERLRERQKELDEARSLEREARFQRDQTASALRRKVVEIRRLLTSALDPPRAATLTGIVGDTAKSSQPALLVSQADAFSSLLRDPRRLAPADLYFDPAAVADTLDPLAAACREAYGRLDEVRRASAASLQARDRARSELGSARRCVVRSLEGWLLLIGRTDLAEKLRPIRRPAKAGKAEKRS